MNKFFGCLGIIVIFGVVFTLIVEYWTFIVGFIGLIAVGFFLVNWKDKRKQERLLANEKRQQLEHQNKIEYKMEQLLTMANYRDKNGSKRQQYLHKEELNLRDYWYKYLDLRAKLNLNNIPTHREEEVLHLMCDELLGRLNQIEVETTDSVRQQFIEENLAPLLIDILDIMEGIHPTQTININAYQLLKTAQREQEPIRLNKK